MRFIFKLYQFYFPESVALKIKAQISSSKAVFSGGEFDISHPTQRKMNSGASSFMGTMISVLTPLDFDLLIATIHSLPAGPKERGNLIS